MTEDVAVRDSDSDRRCTLAPFGIPDARDAPIHGAAFERSDAPAWMTAWLSQERYFAIGGMCPRGRARLVARNRERRRLRYLMAFSPGVMRPPDARGKPRVFISHGTSDPTMPIDITSRSSCRDDALGYDVSYREFDGATCCRLRLDTKRSSGSSTQRSSESPLTCLIYVRQNPLLPMSSGDVDV